MKSPFHIFLRGFIFKALLVYSISANALNEKGILNIRNYSPMEYGAHAQNLCITQDHRGVMYFGNNRGVLEYDGSYWKLIRVSNETSVTALGVDSSGRVYVGADGELGFLKPDAKGNLVYESLNSFIPKEITDLDRINKIHCLSSGTYFVSRSYILLWNGEKMEAWRPETSFHTSDDVNGKLYIREKEKGLYQMKNGNLVLLPGGDFFAEQNVYAVSEFRGELLIATSDNGIFALRNNTFQKINNTSNIYNAVNVGNEYYSVGLFGDGLIILNKNFETEFIIGLQNGLLDGYISFQYVDRENNLWLALGRGIAKIELISPVTQHNFNTGLKGTVQDIVRHKGSLFVSTLNGVFRLTQIEGITNRFIQVKDLSIDCFGIESFVLENDTLLLVAGVDGIYEINDQKMTAERIVAGAPWDIKQSVTYRNRLIIVEENGLSSIVRVDGRWKTEKRAEKITSNIFNFIESPAGDLWLGTMNEGVLKTTTRIFTDEKTPVTRFGTENGLPEGPVFIARIKNGKLAFGTVEGLFQLDEAKGKFSVFEELGLQDLKKVPGIHRLSVDHSGQVWISAFYKDNSYDIMYKRNNEWYKTPFLRHNSEITQSIYHEENGITWLGSASGLIRFDQNFQKDYTSPFTVSIRKVSASGNPVFEGAFFDQDSSLMHVQNENSVPELSYSQNNLVIEFSALSFFDEGGTKFTYMLEGQTEKWSEWSSMPKAVFTNIHEGTYTFRVKAKNIYGMESPETVYQFTVFPPWYRTIWAYIGYFILFIAFVFGAVLVSTRSLKRIIQERTAEIVKQKEEIEKQKEIVEEKNKDILDSINYAKHIQDAILPGEERMREITGRDLFVLFRPKDIVSGDFYWMRVKENKVLFAAVDCTGHGVPGAFVSIVGNNGLNRAVNEFNLVQPAAILDNLTLTVEDAFRQKGSSEVRDGMDISLCSLEMTSFNSAKVDWSGANNPLWIIRKSNPGQIEEIKADKQPIGKFESRKPFTLHSFDLEKGDTIYIFSDGYADQFGGPNGKKFKYSQFKEILLNIQSLSMSEQRDILNSKFDEWKRELEQIDDVCVIGLRI